MWKSIAVSLLDVFAVITLPAICIAVAMIPPIEPLEDLLESPESPLTGDAISAIGWILLVLGLISALAARGRHRPA